MAKIIVTLDVKLDEYNGVEITIWKNESGTYDVTYEFYPEGRR